MWGSYLATVADDFALARPVVFLPFLDTKWYILYALLTID
jgi:hypothetical protein